MLVLANEFWEMDHHTHYFTWEQGSVNVKVATIRSNTHLEREGRSGDCNQLNPTYRTFNRTAPSVPATSIQLKETYHPDIPLSNILDCIHYSDKQQLQSDPHPALNTSCNLS